MRCVMVRAMTAALRAGFMGSSLWAQLATRSNAPVVQNDASTKEGATAAKELIRHIAAFAGARI